MIDQDEYPRTEVIHERVVTMLGRLFHAPADRTPVGTATIGSSEAIMLALLAHKRSWQRRREAAGLAADRPNLVVGADVHTCWEKFARYFEVEARVAPMREGAYTLSAADVAARIDERTIAVGGLLGTTFTGQMDELGPINDLLAETRRAGGLVDPPAHRRGQRRLRDPLLTARPRLGLPPLGSPLDQRLQPQVRARLPGNGDRDLPRPAATSRRSSSSTSTTSAATCRTTR